LKPREGTDLESSRSILAKIFTDYYLSGAQAKKEGKPVVYVSAFTPVEILRAMDVVCMYPESYAVVCAASNKSQEMIHVSSMGSFAQDLCSYSLISFGAEQYSKPPYGGLPEPDMMISTNNQCGTTDLWFDLLAQKKKIPLFTIDYPAPAGDSDSIRRYVARQYESLIAFVKKHTAHDINRRQLTRQVALSRQACNLWAEVHSLNKKIPAAVGADKIVNALFPIVVARGTQMTCDYYEALIHECSQSSLTGPADAARLLWHGYPMWFLAAKFPRGFDDEFQIVLDDYTLWWNLDYGSGSDDVESLITAYSGTYLNKSMEEKLRWVETLIQDYAITGVVIHANRSCRRALADIIPLRELLSKKAIPSVVIESDMANPDFYAEEQIKLRIESLKDILKV
jgi:benzoyl-CoA reductase/2-hydroxyglutaryl-CoA dehydratase subunit BcrC/BadD/HgdB